MAMKEKSGVDLDFHIQFPTPKSDKNDNSNDEALVKDRIWPVDSEGKGNFEGKEALVVLLGWSGAQDKHLAKYSEFYLQRGCIVLRYISPLRALLTDTWLLPELASRLVQLLQDLQLEGHPTFFHVFSNGGGFLYSHILQELAARGDEIKIDLRGTIFDSSPAPRNLWACFFALVNIFSDFPWVRWLMAGAIVMILVIQVFWYHIKTATSFCWLGDNLDAIATRNRNAPLTNYLGEIARPKNHNYLFLFSDADDLIPSHQIVKFADILESRGNRVERVNFGDSEHVAHYRKYPNEYINAITDFIRGVMKENRGPAVLWKEY